MNQGEIEVGIDASTRWKELYPGAAIGILALRGAAASAPVSELDPAARQVEEELRRRFESGGRGLILADPVISAYAAYYRGFKKTYHVALQVESVATKGKRIPSAGALVTAMFIAELSSFLLTAGHDLAALQMPLRVDVGLGTESYGALGGAQRVVKESDMMIADSRGVISSIIGGPDQRTSITEATRDVLYAVYAPRGVPEATVRRHLEEIERLVRMASPGTARDILEIVRAP